MNVWNVVLQIEGTQEKVYVLIVMPDFQEAEIDDIVWSCSKGQEI